MNDDLEPLPPLKPFNGRCNARSRQRRGYCKAGSTSPNGRCHYHGGPTPKGIANPNYMTGKTSKYQYLPGTLQSRFDQINGDVLDNLEESIEIQKALETRLLERIDTGESKLAWESLSDEIAMYRMSDVPTSEDDPLNDAETRLSLAVRTIDRLEGIIDAGSRSFAVQAENRTDIQRIHESQRKLTETLTKCRKEVQETYTAEQWNAFLGSVLLALRTHVEGSILTKIIGELEQRSVPVLTLPAHSVTS